MKTLRFFCTALALLTLPAFADDKLDTVLRELEGLKQRVAVLEAANARLTEQIEGGLATLRWDNVPGADAYLVGRDGKEIPGPLRIEGSQKLWKDHVRK